MPFGRRLLTLLVVLAAAGIPAGALRAVCAGRSCDRYQTASTRVPFCPLPDRLKADIAAGYRAGRSPDVLTVTRGPDVTGDASDLGAPNVTVSWPSLSGGPSTAVPIVFAGAGIAPGAGIPPRTGLDAIAPTLADVIGLSRPHPEVRAGQGIRGVADGQRPTLVLLVAWKGIGSREMQAHPGAWPFLRSLMAEGAGTLTGDTGSVPLDPAATLTTIGTGGLPSQHGITGTLLRNDRGELTRAWSRGAPPSVIATLGDDLDRAMGERPMIGLVAADVADRGLIGGTWYIGHDRDALAAAGGKDQVPAVVRMLASGFGADAVPDLLGVVMRGSIAEMDRDLRKVVAAARRAGGGNVTVAVAGTGSSAGRGGGGSLIAGRVVDRVERAVPGAAPVVLAAVPGGLFLDQDTLAEIGVSGDVAVQALLGAVAAGGSPLVADAFQGFAVSFARYC